MSSLEEHRKPTQIRRGVLIITIAHRRTHVLTVDLGRGTDFAPDFLHADRSDSHLQVGRKQSLEKNFFFFALGLDLFANRRKKKIQQREGFGAAPRSR